MTEKLVVWLIHKLRVSSPKVLLIVMTILGALQVFLQNGGLDQYLGETVNEILKWIDFILLGLVSSKNHPYAIKHKIVELKNRWAA